jgi:galactose-1-phosphate uridylyltransferase
LSSSGRRAVGRSVLFPNLYPYGRYSAVSIFDDQHFVEIGDASVQSYADSLVNCAGYLTSILDTDPEAIYTAITQNHLPSAGGSLVHPHLQVNADRIPANQQRFLERRCREFFERRNAYLFSTYLDREIQEGTRYIGRTGDWQWMAAFAPEGFFEIWGILPGATSIRTVASGQWVALAEGVTRIQKFYRGINRNGYNLGLLSTESPASPVELRTRMVVRSNFAPWVRSDYTGFEVMLGDMTTFIAPERTAELARPFFRDG